MLLAGKESFLREEYTRQLIDMLKGAHGEVDVVRFDGAQSAPADVLDECRSLGLLAGHKVVVVDDANELVKEAARPLFERYAQSPTDGATLVLRAEVWHKGKLDAMIGAVGVVLECRDIGPAQAANWVVRRAQKRFEATFDRDAAELMVERLGVSLTRLDTEIEKLCAGASGPVTRGDVLALVGVSREEAVWAIQGELIGGDPERAVGAVREALEVGRHPPVLVAWAMNDMARRIHSLARAASDGADLRQVSSKIKNWGPIGGAIEAMARRMDPGAAAEVLGLAVETDAGQKSGALHPERALERLAIRFARATPGR